MLFVAFPNGSIFGLRHERITLLPGHRREAAALLSAIWLKIILVNLPSAVRRLASARTPLATFIAAVFVFVATRLFRVFTFVCFLVLAIKQAPEQQSLHGWSSAFCSKTAGFYAIQNLCYNYVCNILS